MRKLAPVFVLTSIVALTSGSALALGDRNKEKKSPNADTTTATQSSTYSSGASATGSSKADGTHGSTVSGTALDKPTDGAAVSSTASSNKAACKGLAKSDPAYAANQCDQVNGSAQAPAGTSRTSPSGSGK
jgi:hypothetical protein